jgi:hypothetical protein
MIEHLVGDELRLSRRRQGPRQCGSTEESLGPTLMQPLKTFAVSSVLRGVRCRREERSGNRAIRIFDPLMSFPGSSGVNPYSSLLS